MRTTAPPGQPPVRKSVTAVFVDLVGSTAFGERLDPEAVRAAIAPYHELVRVTIEDHAGTLVKFMGDGAMAVFGLLEVAEDDALRAVTAGVDLQRRFRGFADDVRDRHGVELGLRIGINSGELVVAEEDADLVGDVLNTAARLESACEPGAVLVGEDTWRLTRSVVEYAVLGEVRVKGKAEPVASFRVLDEERTIADEIPFVGRESELSVLLDAFVDACDSAMARLVTVIGAPGVGKTRLAAELRGAVDARSFDLRFERRGSTTFTPVAQLLREVTDGTVDAVDRLLGDHTDAERLVPVIHSLLGHGEARTTEESFWAIRRLCEHLASDEPVIVVVDDIQWAEPLFWDLLDHLVEWAQAPVLIVALARPELRELRPELAQTGRRVAAAISLEGLDASATRELAARLLETDELPGELLERIPASTDGNPLFVRELVQMLVDDGTLARDGDHWRLTIDADAIEVPPTIMSLLASRVERLLDDERQVVELASVIGTEFDRGTLTAIAGADITGRLGSLLDRLRRKDLIEPSGTWAGNHPVYRFHHVLIRDAAYRRLLKGRRAELHELVGRHYDGREHTDERDVVVAHHYEQTVRYRRELGDVDDATRAMAQAAIARLHRAADDAINREDLPAAGGYARRALELVEPDETIRDELLVVACEALLSSGDVATATPLVRELHERSSDERLAAWADSFRAQRWSLTDPDRLVEAAQLADDAAERLGALDDQGGVARARLVRAGCLARLGRVGECEQELDLALGAARTAGDRRRTVAVLGAAPIAALWGPSPVARAGGRCLDVLRLLRITTASPAVEATSIRCQGVLEALRGRFDSAREKLEASRATARELGLRQGLYETELFAGWVELWAGDPAAAEPYLRAARDGLGRLGIGPDAGQAAALLAIALLALGGVDEAEALATEAVETAGQNLQTAIAGGTALAQVRAVQGRHEEAVRLAEEALETAARTDIVLDHALASLRAARVAELAGDPRRAGEHAERAAVLLDAKGVSNEALPPPAHGPERTGVDVATPELSNSALTISVDAARAFIDGDRERYLALAHDDYVMKVHATLSHSVFAGLEMSRAEQADFVFDSVQSLERPITYDVLAVRGDDLCLKRASTSGDEEAVAWFLVIETRDGRLAREDWFGPDQLDLAFAELDRRWAARADAGSGAEREGPSSLEAARAEDERRNDPSGRARSSVANRAWRAWEQLREAWTERDRPAVVELLSEDFRCIGQDVPDSGAPIGRGVYVDALFDDEPWTTAGDRDSTPLASRGEHLCLYRSLEHGDREGEWLTLVVTDQDGKVKEVQRFGEDHWTEARDQLDRRWWTPLGHPEQADFLTAIYHAWESFEPDALRSVITEDFERVDHRALGLGTMSADAFVAAMSRVRHEMGGARMLLPELIDHVDVRLTLTTVDFRKADDRIEMLALSLTRDGLLARQETFDLADLALARARFAELASSLDAIPSDELEERTVIAGGSPAADRLGAGDEDQAAVDASAQLTPPTGSPSAGVADLVSHSNRVTPQMRSNEPPVIENAATRFNDHLATDVLDDDWRVDDAVEPGFRFQGRRTSGVHVDGGIEHLRATADFWRGSDVNDIENEVVAVRDERLALVSTTLVLQSDDRLTWLALLELGGAGRLASVTTFDTDQLRDAVDELDRRWATTPDRQRIADDRIRLRAAFDRRDADAVRGTLTDDVEFSDHRPVGFGVTTVDDWLATLAPFFADDVEVVIFDVTIPGLQGSTCLTRHRTVDVTSGSTWDSWSVRRMRDDRSELVEFFPVEQFAEARARFAELTAATAPASSPAAVQAWRRNLARYGEWWQNGDVEAIADWLRSDLVIVPFRKVVGPGIIRGEEAIAAVLALREHFSSVSVEILAERSDDLSLVRDTKRSDAGMELTMLIVGKSDADGRLERMATFDEDQLLDALDLLDDWWDESGGSGALAAIGRASRRAYAVAGIDREVHPFADDFLAIDHRPIGFGTRSLEEFLASADLMTPADVIVTRYLDLRGDLQLYELRVVRREDGAVWHQLHVTRADAAGIHELHSFDPDQVSEARRLLDELAAAPTA